MNFTASQQEAIRSEGNVLVLAGAGTGKTHTMVERCLNRLFRPMNPIYLDQILMVTFTEAAAAEMKRRIAEKLNQRFDAETFADPKAAAQAKQEQRVAEQLALLDMAGIGTLHSIALGLILEHSHELRLSPQLRTLSPAERDALEKEALAETLEAGRRESPAIRQWMRQADVHKVRAWILQLHAHTQLLPAPEQWMRQQRERYESESPNLWLRWLSEALTQWLDAFLPALNDGAESCPNLQSCLDALETLRPSLAHSDDNPSAFADCFGRIAAADQAWPQGQKTRARKPLKEFFEDALFFESLFRDKDKNQPGLSLLRQDWEQCRRQVLDLVQLAEDFQKRFRKRKIEREALDFHDMEQFALDLLCGRNRDEDTETAREMRERFEYVFADEYQDITQAQDAILRALSRQGNAANLFLVGDEKQSIYRFRGATPKLLRDYKSAWERRPTSAVIRLQDNFRSHPRLLRFFNDFFASLAQQTAGFHYEDGDCLLPAQSVDNLSDAGPQVEFHLALKTKENRADARKLEARIIARRIRSLMDEKTEILDAGQPRPAKWSDFAVLLRSLSPNTQANSPSSAARLLSQVFRDYEIPAQTPADNFFDLPEIQDLLALLKILDNPLQDIPLLAVLRSPFCGLDPDELAVVRLAQPKGCFWHALRRFHKNPEDDSPQLQTIQKSPSGRNKTWLAEAREKCGQFLANYERWKLAGRTRSTAERVERILAESCYLEALSSRDSWRNPQAQAQQFLQLARDFERQFPPGLARFLQFIDELCQSKHEIEPVPPEASNAVHIMSVHKSKGLEFPIVILANLDKRFNTEDVRQPLILDDRYGLCWSLQLPGTAQTYPSLPHWLGKRKQREKLIAEEARLLYVALTRARERLLLIGAAAEKAILETWTKRGGQKKQRAGSFLDWLGPWFVGQTRLASDANLRQSSENGIYWEIHSDLAEDEPRPPSPAGNASPKPAAVDLETLRQRLNWRYPFLAATTQRSKASASVLKQQGQPDADNPQPLPAKFKTKKQKTEDGAQESAQIRGQAWHRVLQFLSPDQATHVEDARAAIQTLVDQNCLQPGDQETIQLRRIVEFWTSETGTQIRSQNPRHLRRELKFTAQFAGRELREIGFDVAEDPAVDNVPMILQGAVDLALIQPQEIWLLDFKSDKITAKELPERTQLHTPQLALYRAALQKIYRRPVTRAWLHFLHLNATTTPLNPPQ